MKDLNFSCVMSAPRRVKIEIYGIIGPSWAGMIDARMVADALNEVGEADEIELRINSRGGDAYEGLAIASILRDHSAKKIGIVDGIAASAATLPLAVCDEVRIPKNALFMIHNPHSCVCGDETDLLAGVEMWRRVKTAVISLYADKTKKSEVELSEMMRTTTWFSGDEAVAAGFGTTTEKALPKDKAPKKEGSTLSFRALDPNSLPALAALSVCQLQLPKEPSMAAETTKTPETPVVENKTAEAVVPAVELKTETAKPVVAAEVATPAAVAPVVAAPTLTQADIARAATEATNAAITNERNRISDITALCAKAGRPEMAAGFTESGAQVADVQVKLFEALCQDRKPSDDGGTSMNQAAKDVDSGYKAEYAKQRSAYMAAGMSEADYVAQRRLDDEVDVFKPNMGAETKAA